MTKSTVMVTKPLHLDALRRLEQEVEVLNPDIPFLLRGVSSGMVRLERGHLREAGGVETSEVFGRFQHVSSSC